MKKFLLIAFTLVLLPVTVEGMSSKKKDKKKDVQTNNEPQVLSHEKAALKALKECDPGALEKYLAIRGFDINYYFPAKDYYEVFKNVWKRRTLLEAALCMNVPSMEEDQDMRYQQCLDMILSHRDLDANSLNEDNWAPLHLAAMNGNSFPLVLMLSRKERLHLNLNARGFLGETPLFVAATLDEMHKVHVHRLLAEPEIDLTITNETGTPFFHALADSSAPFDTMLALAERGVSVNAVYKNQTPIKIAFKFYKNAGSPSTSVAELAVRNMLGLLALGAHLEQELAASLFLAFLLNDSDAFADRCFVSAINGTTVEMEERWHRHNPDLDIHDRLFGMTPCMWAAARGNMLLAQQLIDLGANPLEVDNFGNTALHHAVRNGHIAMANFLKTLAPKAYIMKNKFKRTPVDVAISSKQSREMLQTLAQ